MACAGAGARAVAALGRAALMAATVGLVHIAQRARAIPAECVVEDGVLLTCGSWTGTTLNLESAGIHTIAADAFAGISGSFPPSVYIRNSGLMWMHPDAFRGADIGSYVLARRGAATCETASLTMCSCTPDCSSTTMG